MRPGSHRLRSAASLRSCWPPSITPRSNFDVPSPLKGLKKPASQPRLHSFTKEDEEAIYGATEESFRNFLFAAIHTGLRPYCELARLTADDVEENGRGMMWRVYSSKTRRPARSRCGPRWPN